MDLETGRQQPEEPAHPPTGGLEQKSVYQADSSLYERYKKFFIIIGAGCGVVTGIIAKASEASAETLLLIGYPGEMYINGLMLMVVPYICCSMLVSQRPDTSGNDTGGMGKTALICYSCTTALAVIEALIFTNIFAPGNVDGPAAIGLPPRIKIAQSDLQFYAVQDDRGRNYIVADTMHGPMQNISFQQEMVTGQPSNELWALPSGTGSAMESILSIGDQILPRNVIKTYYSTNLLGLIVFNLLLGQAIAKQPRCEPVFDGIATVADALMSVVLAVVEFTPIGIGSLIAKGMGNPNDNDMGPYRLSSVIMETRASESF